MKSSALRQKYKNNIFVGDYNNGNLYYFELNSTRTGIKPQAGLSGLVVNNEGQLSAVTFGTGFGAISDIKTGPTDGFLYVLSINDGTIYKIVPCCLHDKLLILLFYHLQFCFRFFLIVSFSDYSIRSEFVTIAILNNAGLISSSADNYRNPRQGDKRLRGLMVSKMVSAYAKL
jgi:hypothetical protein